VILAWLACAEDPAACSERDPPLGYVNFGRAFLAEYCTGCHSAQLPGADRYGAPEGVDLDTLDGARTWLDRVVERAAGEDASMPPSGPADAEDRAMLSEWASCGMPE
jgi:uncharacterized membrane protein